MHRFEKPASPNRIIKLFGHKKDNSSRTSSLENRRIHETKMVGGYNKGACNREVVKIFYLKCEKYFENCKIQEFQGVEKNIVAKTFD